MLLFRQPPCFIFSICSFASGDFFDINLLALHIQLYVYGESIGLSKTSIWELSNCSQLLVIGNQSLHSTQANFKKNHLVYRFFAFKSRTRPLFCNKNILAILRRDRGRIKSEVVGKIPPVDSVCGGCEGGRICADLDLEGGIRWIHNPIIRHQMSIYIPAICLMRRVPNKYSKEKNADLCSQNHEWYVKSWMQDDFDCFALQSFYCETPCTNTAMLHGEESLLKDEEVHHLFIFDWFLIDQKLLLTIAESKETFANWEIIQSTQSAPLTQKRVRPISHSGVQLIQNENHPIDDKWDTNKKSLYTKLF